MLHEFSLHRESLNSRQAHVQFGGLRGGTMPPALSSIIMSAARAVRRSGVIGALRHAKRRDFGAGFWNGGLLVALLKTDGAILKGVDSLGNKYWEKMQDQHGRHRWVEYASTRDYGPCSVPLEWHGWLHHITDHTPEQHEERKPRGYGLDWSGEIPKYMAKGYAFHPHRRVWKSFEIWQPAATRPSESQVTTGPRPDF